jgi:SsrA-binding protein
MRSDELKVVATNRKARYEYTIGDRYEAGIALTGSEIKSVRAGAVSLAEGFVQARDGELWLVDVHIAGYEQAGLWTHDPRRPRKLLLHRREIGRLLRDVQEPGYKVRTPRWRSVWPVASVSMTSAPPSLIAMPSGASIESSRSMVTTLTRVSLTRAFDKPRPCAIMSNCCELPSFSRLRS